MSYKKIFFYVSLIAISLLLFKTIFQNLFEVNINKPRDRWTPESIRRQLQAGHVDRGFKKFFDRDPEREIPNESNIIVSPADGKVISIEKTGENFRIVINLSFYDVHVQRVPISGKVLAVEQKKGEFLPNRGKRYLIDNFKFITTLDTAIGKVQIEQISGLYAKRIKVFVKAGDNVIIGQRLGRILLGSTVVLIFPVDIKIINVSEGERIFAGSTILARY